MILITKEDILALVRDGEATVEGTRLLLECTAPFDVMLATCKGYVQSEQDIDKERMKKSGLDPNTFRKARQEQHGGGCSDLYCDDCYEDDDASFYENEDEELVAPGGIEPTNIKIRNLKSVPSEEPEG